MKAKTTAMAAAAAMVAMTTAFAAGAGKGKNASTGDAAADAEIAALNEKIGEMLKTAPKGPHGGKIISPELKELMDRRSGGLVYPKTNGKTLLIVDARGGEDDGFAEAYAKGLKRNFFLGVTVKRAQAAAGKDLFEEAAAFKSEQHPAVVMIVDLENKPTVSAYPEDAVGVVNAAKLKTEDKAKYKERLTKETWRTLALATGGFATTAPNGRIVKSILSPAYGTAQLDAIGAVALSPHQCNAIYESVAAIGLQASKPATYKMACRQGWAPAPTNTIQKAIWNQVHALPSEPMKIKPETKKQAK